MIRSSLSQMRAESIQATYRQANKLVDAYVKMGHLQEAEKEIAFAKLVQDELDRHQYHVKAKHRQLAQEPLPFIDEKIEKTARRRAAEDKSSTARPFSSPPSSGSLGQSTAGLTAAAPVGASALVSSAAVSTAQAAALATAKVAVPLGFAAVAAELVVDARRCNRGEITVQELNTRAAVTAAGGGGGIAGAVAAGALMGSFFPGVGTAIGGIVGGLACTIGARKLTRSLLESRTGR